MERINTGSENDMEIYENKIDLYLHDFFSRFVSPDSTAEEIEKYIFNATQSQFIAGLMYIQKHVFNDRSILKDEKNEVSKLTIVNKSDKPIYTNYNRYSYEKLNVICEYLIYISNIYNKTVSINSFCKLTGIHTETVRLWNNPTCACFDIYKRLVDENEKSLANILQSGKVNPVGILAILNHKYNWNSSALPDIGYHKKALSANELPTIELLSDNSKQNAQNEKP